MKFENQIAIVTGASRGIGKSIALALAKEGATVVSVATTLEGASASSDWIHSETGRASHAFACNIGDASSVEALTNFMSEKIGSPSILVNNAGITRDAILLRMKDEDWDDVMTVNLKGTFLMIRAFTKPMMKARYGRIVNLASVIGQSGGAGQANYAASKAGIEGLTKSVAKEYGSRGITCNAVAPGFIETDMTAHLSPEMREHVMKNAPLQRLGSSDDVAAAVLFLASPEAAYITGQTLTVDGGLTL